MYYSLQVAVKIVCRPLSPKETQLYFMRNLRNLRQCPAGGFSF